MGGLLRQRCGLVCFSFLLLLGFFSLCVFPLVFQTIVNKEFGLSASSRSFRHWQRTPLPMTLDVYMFNWTNAERLDDGEKPRFEEVGPYRFYETREKVNITWNENGTVSYRLRRTWRFSGEESGRLSLDDSVTTINGVALSAAFMVRRELLYKQAQINLGLMLTRQRTWVTRTVGELLFDGYDDPLMSASSLFSSISPVSSPFDKFGWFYKKNDSYTYDGWLTVDTGAGDMAGLGAVRRWNGRARTAFYPGECGAVRGFSGDLFPPGRLAPGDAIHLFSHDLCRSVPFAYAGESEVRGVRALRFNADFGRPSSTADDDGDDSCYCGGECVPSGFLNLTACRYGAPVFVSLPHFHGARERFYLDSVDGLRPDPARHEFHFAIEPTFGIPIDVGARVQINMLLQKIPEISLYKEAPRVMVPVLWADQRVRITEPLAAELRAAVAVPGAVRAAGVAATGAAAALAIALRLAAWRARAK